MMNMYSNAYTLPDSDEEEEENLKQEILNLEAKNKYVKLNEIQEVDNKLEIDKDDTKKEGEENGENKKLIKDNEKDKTLDMSNRSLLDPLIKEGEEKKVDLLIENAPTTVTKVVVKNKGKKEKQKGQKFDTVNKIFSLKSDLVFMCMGKLKLGGDTIASENHIWVMTIDPRFKDVEFWEPMNNRSYKLCDRIEFSDILRKYMSGKHDTMMDIQIDIKKKTAKEKSEKIIESKKLF